MWQDGGVLGGNGYIELVLVYWTAWSFHVQYKHRSWVNVDLRLGVCLRNCWKRHYCEREARVLPSLGAKLK